MVKHGSYGVFMSYIYHVGIDFLFGKVVNFCFWKEEITVLQGFSTCKAENNYNNQAITSGFCSIGKLKYRSLSIQKIGGYGIYNYKKNM